MYLTILGGGSWGTALAQVLSYNFEKVYIWDIDKQVLKDIQEYHQNKKYHPNVMLAHNIIPIEDIQEATNIGDIIVVAIPSQFVRQTLSNVKIEKEKPIISASKGIEIESLKLMSQVIEKSLNLDLKYIFALSGPSFAKEVIMGLPTAVVLAGDTRLGKDLQKILSTKTFRVYLSDDVVGAEVGGSVKNVIAIACGISDGLGFGNNARASLITRGLYEISKIVKEFGGNPQTVYGLSGLGDLILTATGDLSRNRKFGILIGQGYNVEDAIKEIGQIVEGYTTVKALNNLVKEKNIDLPISQMVYKVVYEGLDPKLAAEMLMIRDLKSEF
ncbi:glycerol-3-phosphate dehydrogenase [NAD(P)+] (NAD(P)H-dependent glycerol-3-phosphate dehydrogenase) (NAD(P)H-dependentdihydroxyacetone-phosphate reductase) [Sulfurihydrogenibium azorense Az-Fu1]|uniref:Glycerol-3-phosphate dehydrogenase [NAD(P)+] n=1 Tax=Sulfurihydrogenibium azorense (strain DSM 15241 / OCM 825 / Az-Fu1) TaxID=204536 RepID=C1DX99_SULAA|nr:NAD(P)H-dependent glycerol-3-phosphate dehydrogenase [Sulfurihydrogenibium azorense]ACN99746.1 glycerol-3-phosphate dehydrogenase [NAD(P)+] (NAD(P)H-dependent glycerol-3-phosphate dehydrogenase) (NAD(P)H-dependentdihydroxyacetone-phosphate reductase) [Sulfurihydrogenibium azorense Az-Fu1]